MSTPVLPQQKGVVRALGEGNGKSIGWEPGGSKFESTSAANQL